MCTFNGLRRALAIAALSVLAGLAFAQRQLPQDAKYAKKIELHYPSVKIGKNTLRMAVGGKIYNEQNMIIMPTAAPTKADVLYRLDINGEVSQLWLLTPDESKAAADRK